MVSYTAYGLIVQSELVLPELLPGRDPCDVTIRFGQVALPEESTTDTVEHYDGTTDTLRRFSKTPDGVILSWSHVGTFKVGSGREIVIHPDAQADEQLIRQIVLGPLFGILLSQRGLAVFHASSTSFPAGAVLLMAGKGHGKSTLAAALHARGHTLITDDVAALRFEDRLAWVIPGIPQMKLWPEAITALKGDSRRYPKVKKELEKRVIPVAERFASEAGTLRCVYVLDVGESTEIRPLQPKEALRAVANQWYGALFQGQLLRILGLERHFRESLSLIEKAPVYLLKRPLSYELFDDICQALECHVSTLEISA